MESCRQNLIAEHELQQNVNSGVEMHSGMNKPLAAPLTETVESLSFPPKEMIKPEIVHNITVPSDMQICELPRDRILQNAQGAKRNRKWTSKQVFFTQFRGPKLDNTKFHTPDDRNDALRLQFQERDKAWDIAPVNIQRVCEEKAQLYNKILSEHDKSRQEEKKSAGQVKKNTTQRRRRDKKQFEKLVRYISEIHESDPDIKIGLFWFSPKCNETHAHPKLEAAVKHPLIQSCMTNSIFGVHPMHVIQSYIAESARSQSGSSLQYSFPNQTDSTSQNPVSTNSPAAATSPHTNFSQMPIGPPHNLMPVPFAQPPSGLEIKVDKLQSTVDKLLNTFAPSHIQMQQPLSMTSVIHPPSNFAQPSHPLSQMSPSLTSRVRNREEEPLEVDKTYKRARMVHDGVLQEQHVDESLHNVNVPLSASLHPNL